MVTNRFQKAYLRRSQSVPIDAFSEGVEFKMAQEVSLRGNVKFANSLAYIVISPEEIMMKGYPPPQVLYLVARSHSQYRETQLSEWATWE